MAEPTYIFQDGHVFTLVEGKVVTSVPEGEFGLGGAMDSNGVGPVEMPPPPPDIQNDLQDAAACPECGSPSSPMDHFCPQCGAPLTQDSPGSIGADQYDVGAPERATAIATVTTPNGLKGKVLGKVAGLWSDEVTVRLENGNIIHLPVNKDFKFANEEPEIPADPIKALGERLGATVEGDADSLKARARELERIKITAQKLVEGASDVEAVTLDEIYVTATYEAKEVDDALQHLAELEGQGFEPPAPFRTEVVEQESLGGGDASWLDSTLNEMVAEAEATDYDKLMNEGPEAFVAELDDPALAEAGATRSMASTWIRSKTAAAEPQVRERYEKVWLARIEECRRAELANRKTEVATKEAAVQEEDYSGLPDEFGFGV